MGWQVMGAGGFGLLPLLPAALWHSHTGTCRVANQGFAWCLANPTKPGRLKGERLQWH